ncbi:MAG: hypothetical protein S4CHLAM102_11760 [Chlamydiia bacterium]|nr:hypothetical protein [Chlamydiia bacterium]
MLLGVGEVVTLGKDVGPLVVGAFFVAGADGAEAATGEVFKANVKAHEVLTADKKDAVGDGGELGTGVVGGVGKVVGIDAEAYSEFTQAVEVGFKGVFDEEEG